MGHVAGQLGLTAGTLCLKGSCAAHAFSGFFGGEGAYHVEQLHPGSCNNLAKRGGKEGQEERGLSALPTPRGILALTFNNSQERGRLCAFPEEKALIA